MCPGMKIVWAFCICAKQGTKKEVFLTKDLLQRALEDSNPRPFGP